MLSLLSLQSISGASSFIQENKNYENFEFLVKAVFGTSE